MTRRAQTRRGTKTRTRTAGARDSGCPRAGRTPDSPAVLAAVRTARPLYRLSRACAGRTPDVWLRARSLSARPFGSRGLRIALALTARRLGFGAALALAGSPLSRGSSATKPVTGGSDGAG